MSCETTLDADLIPVLDRDPAAFETFYRRHVDKVAGFATRRLRDPEQVADVVASTFMGVIESAGRYDRRRGEPVSWLLGVAFNVLRSHQRRERGEAATAQRLSGRRLLDADAYEALEDRIDSARLAEPLAAAVAALPNAERELFELVSRDHLTPSQAAAVLGIRAPTARVRLARARQKLRHAVTTVATRSAMLLATAAALVTAVAVAVPVLRPIDSASAQVITVTSTPSGENVVTFPGGDPETGEDPETDGRRIVANMRQSGLEVKVNEIPVSPSFVGSTFGYDFPPGDGLATTEAGLTIDPEVYDGTVAVDLGVTPEPGQAYERFGDAFSPAEPLAGLPCVLDDRGDVATFERLVREEGIEVEWHFLAFEGDRPPPPQAGATVPEELQNFLYLFVADVRYLPEGPFEGMVVGQATTLAENKVAVTMVWPGTRDYDNDLSWSLYRGESEDLTPELAEADATSPGGLCGSEATGRWR